MLKRALVAALFAGLVSTASAQTAAISVTDINARVEALGPRLVAWRRDIHAHPELGNRETRTAALVAAHLRRLGMEVHANVAVTGVIGVLRGGRPGPVVALRSELDALPVHEDTGLPFASTVQTTYNGQSTYVAHACGHDMHIAMLMGAAEVLAGMRAQLPGTIVFVFQPAEEGPPSGEEGGAALMLKQNALNPMPSAIFGIHVVPGAPGSINYRPEGLMAAADELHINLHGRQTHGAWPNRGIDIISLQSAIVSELNTVAARTVDVTQTPTVISITAVNGGNRWNIIPQDLAMLGTLRTFDRDQRVVVMRRIEQTVQNLAQTYGATAEVQWVPHGLVTYNDPALTAWALPAMTEAAGAGHVNANVARTMVSEDFSYFQERVPGLFVHLGMSAQGQDPAQTAPNHSPQFSPNESILPLGVRTHVMFAVRYLESGGLPARR